MFDPWLMRGKTRYSPEVMGLMAFMALHDSAGQQKG